MDASTSRASRMLSLPRDAPWLLVIHCLRCDRCNHVGDGDEGSPFPAPKFLLTLPLPDDHHQIVHCQACYHHQRSPSVKHAPSSHPDDDPPVYPPTYKSPESIPLSYFQWPSDYPTNRNPRCTPVSTSHHLPLLRRRFFQFV